MISVQFCATFACDVLILPNIHKWSDGCKLVNLPFKSTQCDGSKCLSSTLLLPHYIYIFSLVHRTLDYKTKRVSVTLFVQYKETKTKQAQLDAITIC